MIDYLPWIVFAVVSYIMLRKDDTDNGWFGRSGLIVYVDHKTGVQYVATLLGGPTPRIDADGKPMIDPNWQAKQSGVTTHD